MFKVKPFRFKEHNSAINGLSQVNIELTNVCDKPAICSMCGHQKEDIQRGYMAFNLFEHIKNQIPQDIIVSFHHGGEPTAYPQLSKALSLFYENFTSLVTHGMNLIKCAPDIINNCTTVTVSVHKGDPDAKEQFEVLEKFMRLKGLCPPQVQVKLVGDIDSTPYETIKGLRIIHRALHVPQGNHDYIKSNPPIPEVGICLDLLSKPTIKLNGDISICNRFDPKGLGIIGNIKDQSFIDIWNGWERRMILDAHITGHREFIPACNQCEYWGIPVG